MKRNLIIIFLVVLLFSLNVMALSAQDTNLLTNPGFEAPFENQGGSPARLVANGWQAWHVVAAPGAPNFENTQPEYEEAAPTTARILSGANAQHYFSFFATHTGGVFQSVSGLTPGDEVTFSINAYIWSSTLDDLDSSEDDGDVLFQVGIDPNGGTDGESDNILWSVPTEQYDAYNVYTISAIPEGESVTVWTRSRIGFAVKQSSIYLDDASLTAATSGAEDTPTPTTVVDTDTPTTAPVDTEAPTDTEEPIVTPTATETTGAESPTDTPTSLPLPDDPTETPEGEEPTETPTSVPVTATPTNTPTTASGGEATPTSEGGSGGDATPTSTTEPAAPTPTPTVTVPISDQFPGNITHVVRRGDSVSRIAALYGSSVAAIIQANGLEEAALIFVEQNLIVPVRLIVQTPVPTATPTSTTPAEVPAGTPTSTPVAPPPTANDGTYTVVPGDTLSAIARRFNTTIAALAQLNGIVNPNRVLVGQVLQVPNPDETPTPDPTDEPTLTPTTAPETPSSYVVQPGDTLYRIAIQFNVTMAALIQENSIEDANRIFVGQTLIIP